MTKNLFNKLYEILTSTEEVDVEEQEQQLSSDIDAHRTVLNVR